MCPRLAAFRAQNIEKYPNYFNAPVPSFGPKDAELLIVGLAPGLQGANQTGRPFTNDYAGILLYDTLLKFGFARGEYLARKDDTLELINCRITNAVRCVPPENKPLPLEVKTCQDFLIPELTNPHIKTILALGSIAHQAILKAFSLKLSAYPFKHNQLYDLGKIRLVDSYHCSRYNTNTGKLTTEMFEDVFRTIKAA